MSNVLATIGVALMLLCFFWAVGVGVFWVLTGTPEFSWAFAGRMVVGFLLGVSLLYIGGEMEE